MFRPLIPTQQMKRQNDHHTKVHPKSPEIYGRLPKITTSNRSTKLDWLLSQPLELEVMTVPEQYPLTVPAVLPCRALLPHPDTCTDKTPPRKSQSVDDRKL